MTTKELLHLSLSLQAILGCVVFSTMAGKRKFHVFGQLGVLIALQIVFASGAVLLLYHRKAISLTGEEAYNNYFFMSWFLTLLQLGSRVLAIRAVFAEAMRPLKGLHEVGKIIFRWVAVVSGVVALALVAGPDVTTKREVLFQALAKLDQGVSVLTLCLLVFVCFAVRPLGLTFRSHLFGVSLGLGIASTVELVQTVWALAGSSSSIFSAPYVFGSFGFSTALLVWGVYFALPEPKRRMILLPTTSPFFFWNRISEILGDAPGHVAVAGFSPDMLADAEIEMLTTATANEVAPATEAPKYPSAQIISHLESPMGRDLTAGIQPSLVM